MNAQDRHSQGSTHSLTRAIRDTADLDDVLSLRSVAPANEHVGIVLPVHHEEVVISEQKSRDLL